MAGMAGWALAGSGGLSCPSRAGMSGTSGITDVRRRTEVILPVTLADCFQAIRRWL